LGRKPLLIVRSGRLAGRSQDPLSFLGLHLDEVNDWLAITIYPTTQDRRGLIVAAENDRPAGRL
jgi:hypothetical protein